MKKLKNFMLLLATMAMTLPFYSCDKDDKDENGGKEKEQEEVEWVFTNGLSQYIDDGKTISFAVNRIDVLLEMLDFGDLGEVAGNLQEAIQKIVFKFGYDKDVITSGNVTFYCADENSAKALAALLKQADPEEAGLITVKGSKIIMSADQEDIDMPKEFVEELYTELFAYLNNDGSKAEISAFTDGDGVLYWTITAGGVTKSTGILSIRKEYGYDGDAIISYKEIYKCVSEEKAERIASLQFGGLVLEDEDAPEYTYEVKGTDIIVRYNESEYSDLSKDDVLYIWAFDKEHLEWYE